MRINVSYEIIRIPLDTLNAYKANLIGFLGELFVDYYLMNNYSLQQGSTINIIRRQVSSSDLRNLLYGEFTSRSPFIPHVLDGYIQRVLWLPKGTRIEVRRDIQFLKVQVPDEFVGLGQGFRRVMKREFFDMIFPLLEKNPLFKLSISDEVLLRERALKLFEFGTFLGMGAKVYVLISSIDNMKEVIEVLNAGLGVIDYAVLKGQIERIEEEDEYHLIAEGKIEEIELYEVKSGKQASRRDLVNQILGQVRSILENIEGDIRVKFKLITIPFELDLPRIVRLEVFEIT
ncbi:MAG: hypothetical protein DRN15_07240 [Thermoprotei archaeon]|nr:MAG: hypothetical protein DRN15_07240 [Thermoprotei archaeon]